MRAVGFHRSLPIDDERSLLDLTLPEPVPGPHDLLVRMRASPPDRQPQVLGYDAAGLVEAVGADVSRFRPGDAVF